MLLLLLLLPQAMLEACQVPEKLSSTTATCVAAKRPRPRSRLAKESLPEVLTGRPQGCTDVLPLPTKR